MLGRTNAVITNPVLYVTMLDPLNTGYKSGRTITATNGTDTQQGVTDANGYVRISLKGTGLYTITSNAPSGLKSSSASVMAEPGGRYDIALSLYSKGWGTFGMSFNPTTFKTDPTGCLTYTDNCAGYIPVSGPGSSLAKCSTIGSWEMKADGTSTNPLLNRCFYATFSDAGKLQQKLNPQNLTRRIAIWNSASKTWTSSSGSSNITTANTMFCIPTCYINSTPTKLTLSGSQADGVACAHTINGHTYDYLAIGVYEGYDDGSKLMSLSGKVSSGGITRPTFRSHAQANIVQDGHAMVWNFYQWNLWRIMTIFAMKSFNGQARIGQGGFTYDGNTGQGLCNSMGPFAGSTSTSPSTSKSVKAFIENPWGYKWEFIDDFRTHNDDIWVGQNQQPDDTYNSNKVDLGAYYFNGTAPNVISTAPESWGLGKAMGGSSSTGLCDYQYINSSIDCYGHVGGDSGSVSNGNAGPSCLYAGNSLGPTFPNVGARLAFVFDI